MTQVNATYNVYIDWNGDGDYSDANEDCSADFMQASIKYGFSDPRSRVANPAGATIILDNQNKTYSPPLAANARPYRKVKITMTYTSTVTLFEGYILSIRPTFGEKLDRRVAITATDSAELLNFYDARIALQLDTTADAIIEALAEAVLGSVSASYQSGINVFPFAADRWEDAVKTLETTSSAMDRITAACASDWGRFWFAKDGTPTYINRHQMPLDDSTELVLDNTMVGMSYEMAVTSIYNRVSVTCSPRSVGEAYEVVGRISQQDAPRIEAGDGLSFTVEFRDPSNNSASLGAYAVQSITPYTDVTATADAAGLGDDMTTSLEIHSVVYGDSVGVRLVNSHVTDPIYIQKLQVRGRAVRVREKVTVMAEDDTSIATYGARELKLRMPLISDPMHAKLLADYLLDYYKDPLHDVKGVTFFANRNATLMEAARDLELCDKVELSEEQVGLDAFEGFIYGMTHNIQAGGVHTVTLDLEQAYDIGGTPFRLDSSQLDSGDVLIY